MKVFLFFGAPGSGKGTQANLLKDYLKSKGLVYKCLSTGDLIRNFGNNSESKDSKKTGSIVSVDTIFDLVDSYIEKIKPFDGLIIDGIPRLEAQIKPFLNRFKPELVFYLKFEKDKEHILHERVLKRSNRVYDLNENTRNKRLNEFYSLTLPCFYSFNKKIRHEIKGNQSKEDIFSEVKGLVDKNTGQLL